MSMSSLHHRLPSTVQVDSSHPKHPQLKSDESFWGSLLSQQLSTASCSHNGLWGEKGSAPLWMISLSGLLKAPLAFLLPGNLKHAETWPPNSPSLWVPENQAETHLGSNGDQLVGSSVQGRHHTGPAHWIFQKQGWFGKGGSRGCALVCSCARIPGSGHWGAAAEPQEGLEVSDSSSGWGMTLALD